MKPFLVLLLVSVCFWSIITSLVAIIRILTNEFRGSKVEWILISMIGIIGPLLWILKGRKLIVKRSPEVKRP